MTSNLDKLVNTLVNKGETLTPKQISSRFGLANPHDAIYQLRSEGYSIYSNIRKNSRGETVVQYRYGKPSRKMVAAAFAKHGATIFA